MGLLHWDFAALADHLHATLASAEAAVALEQAVKGLDTLDECAIQGLMIGGLGRHHHVQREVHYPATQGRKLSHRPRCDLVLTPRGQSLDAAPDAALWLEVKVASQFSESGARHPGYSARWHAVIRDFQKLAAEPCLPESALVLVVFTESDAILNKDLHVFENLLVQRRVLAGFRHVRTLSIQNRLGHRHCSVVIWPMPKQV